MQHVGAPAQLVVIGNGEDKEALEAQARTQAPGQVEFVGTKTPKEIQQYQEWADLFVIPSDKEGMPLTVLEAMAAGLPIVAADALGVTELVEGVGNVVQDPTPERLAHAITTLAEDVEALSTLSAKSRACAEAHTWNEARKTVFAAYQSICPDVVLGKEQTNA